MIKRLVQGGRAGFAALAALWVVATLAGTPGAWAQSSRTPAATAAATPTATPASVRPAVQASSTTSSAPAASAPRAAADLRIIEDDQVRIEETRVRGQLQRVSVTPKGSTLKPYEINVGAGGRDPSQDKSGAGQRVWSVLRF